MLVTAKKELELYVTTELRKRPKTTPISKLFEMLVFEQFFDFPIWIVQKLFKYKNFKQLADGSSF